MSEAVPRKGCRVINVTINSALLKEFDELVPPKRRSVELEKMVKERVLRHKFGEQINERDLQEMLALID
jgi:hypothetical protein